MISDKLKIYIVKIYNIKYYYRSARESYGDAGIGYVSLKRENNVCIVEAMITPEHKTRGRYFSSVKIDEEENVIIDVSCSDCAASEGEFNKIISILKK